MVSTSVPDMAAGESRFLATLRRYCIRGTSDKPDVSRSCLARRRRKTISTSALVNTRPFPLNFLLTHPEKMFFKQRRFKLPNGKILFVVKILCWWHLEDNLFIIILTMKDANLDLVALCTAARDGMAIMDISTLWKKLKKNPCRFIQILGDMLQDAWFAIYFVVAQCHYIVKHFWGNAWASKCRRKFLFGD